MYQIESQTLYYLYSNMLFTLKKSDSAIVDRSSELRQISQKTLY